MLSSTALSPFVTMPSVDGSELDPLFDQAVELIKPLEYVGASLLQRKFRIGYSRAALLLDQMEAQGFVGPAIGSKPREVLKK